MGGVPRIPNNVSILGIKFLSEHLHSKIHQNVKAMVNLTEDCTERREEEPAAKNASVIAMALILGDDHVKNIMMNSLISYKSHNFILVKSQ